MDFTNPSKRPWDDLFRLLGEKRNEFGIRVRIPRNAPPKVRSGLEKLNSDIPEDVIYGVKLLGNLKDPIAVSGLIIMLGHDVGDVIIAAQQALIKIGGPAVPQLLRGFLEVEEEHVWNNIVHVLGEIKSDTALFGLLDALHDHRERVRYYATLGLGHMKRAEALSGLLGAIHDSDNIVRSGVVAALIQIGDKAAVPALIEVLQDIDKHIRSTAAGGLGILGDRSAVPALINALHDLEPSVRIAAAHALGRIADPRSVDGLFNLSLDHDAGVRQAGLDALNQIRTPEAMEAINRWPKPQGNA